MTIGVVVHIVGADTLTGGEVVISAGEPAGRVVVLITSPAGGDGAVAVVEIDRFDVVDPVAGVIDGVDGVALGDGDGGSGRRSG
jgi:hypothetical protein